MKFAAITIFPEMFNAITNYGITKRAIARNLAELFLYNPRDYTIDSYGTVDDRPYGGGPGMVMKVEPMLAAINHAKADLQQYSPKVICLSPQGKKVNQFDLQNYIKSLNSIILVCGRYEGIDERIYPLAIDEEWSIGDIILSGGELAAMAFMDAIIRMLPNALNNPSSVIEDSFSNNSELFDYPVYTRPDSIYGLKVPEVLLSGNHQDILNWRQRERINRTIVKRANTTD